MTDLSDRDPKDNVDESYRRAAALDQSRPSERVRRAVLAHAAQVAAQRASGARASRATGSGAMGTAGRGRWPAVLGALAAAALAGLVVAPQLLRPPARAPHAASQATPRPQAMSAAAQPAPAPPPRAAPQEVSKQIVVPKPAAVQELQRRGSGAPAATLAPTPSAETQAPVASPRLKEEVEVTGSRLRRHSAVESNSLLDVPEPAPAADRATSPVAPPPVPGVTARAASAPADPDAQLRQAAEAGDVAGLQRLLGGQADINARDATGRTALMLATLGGQIEAVETLLAHGADPNAADTQGVRPLQAAISGNRQAIATALRGAGAR